MGVKPPLTPTYPHFTPNQNIPKMHARFQIPCVVWCEKVKRVNPTNRATPFDRYVVSAPVRPDLGNRRETSRLLNQHMDPAERTPEHL